MAPGAAGQAGGTWPWGSCAPRPPAECEAVDQSLGLLIPPLYIGDKSTWRETGKQY